MIKSFKDDWLSEYYWKAVNHRKIQKTIEKSLQRKLDLIHVACAECDLLIPPGNRFEHLSGNLEGWCSICVNKQYRLIFKWDAGKASDVYLDPHTYK